MAVTVTNNMTLVSNCDGTTGWSGGSTYSGFQREGSNCLGAQISNTEAQYTYSISVDLSATVIYAWFKADAAIETQANGGFQIGVTDGSNGRSYYVGGSDSYGFQVGAWTCFILDTGNLPTGYTQTTGSSAPSFASATGIIIGFTTTSKSLGPVANCFWDIIRYVSNSSPALTISGGTSSVPGVWADIAADDASTSSGKAYGIVRELQSGVYGIQGALQFGDTGTSDSYFEDTNTILVFEDRLVVSSYYDITLLGNSTGTNTFVMGEKSGTAGISGCTFISAGSSKTTFDLDDTNFNTVGLYGCTFTDVGTITLPATAAGKEMLSCNINVSAEVLASTCTVQYCTFVASDGRAIKMDSTSHNISDCSFINCPHGVNIPNTGTYTFDNLTFTGEDGSTIYAIENSSTGLVTVDATNGSNPTYADNTNGGSTTINNAVTLTVTVKDTSGTVIENARVLMEADTGGNAPHEESVSITRSGSTATVTHTSHGLSSGNVVAIRGANEVEYNESAASITYIGTDSYSYEVEGTPDTPATGTITSTQVMISELTNASGIATESWNYNGDQPYTISVRKSSSSPYYAPVTGSGTITSAGVNLPITMQEDE